DTGQVGGLQAADAGAGAPGLLVVSQLAAGDRRELEGGEEAVADPQRVDLDRLLGPRDDPPVGVDLGVYSRLDALAPLRAHDDAAMAQRDAPPQELQPVARRVAKEPHVSP